MMDRELATDILKLITQFPVKPSKEATVRTKYLVYKPYKRGKEDTIPLSRKIFSLVGRNLITVPIHRLLAVEQDSNHPPLYEMVEREGLFEEGSFVVAGLGAHDFLKPKSMVQIGEPDLQGKVTIRAKFGENIGSRREKSTFYLIEREINSLTHIARDLKIVYGGFEITPLDEEGKIWPGSELIDFKRKMEEDLVSKTH